MTRAQLLQEAMRIARERGRVWYSDLIALGCSIEYAQSIINQLNKQGKLREVGEAKK